MDIYHDRDEWEDGTSEPTWEDVEGQVVSDPGKITIPQAEVYLEVHEGIPWNEHSTMVSD